MARNIANIKRPEVICSKKKNGIPIHTGQTVKQTHTKSFRELLQNFKRAKILDDKRGMI